MNARVACAFRKYSVFVVVVVVLTWVIFFLMLISAAFFFFDSQYIVYHKVLFGSMIQRYMLYACRLRVRIKHVKNMENPEGLCLPDDERILGALSLYLFSSLTQTDVVECSILIAFIYLLRANDGNNNRTKYIYIKKNKRKMTVIIPVSKNVSIFAIFICIFIFSSACAFSFQCLFLATSPFVCCWALHWAVPFGCLELECIAFRKCWTLFTWNVHGWMSGCMPMPSSIFACANLSIRFWLLCIHSIMAIEYSAHIASVSALVRRKSLHRVCLNEEWQRNGLRFICSTHTHTRNHSRNTSLHPVHHLNGPRQTEYRYGN